MKNTITLSMALIALAACATPVTTLQHPKTKQVVTCGGGTAGSWTGGAIGYDIQKDNDAKCVENYESLGFAVITSEAK